MKKGGALFYVFNAVFVWEIDRLSRIENRIAFKKESLLSANSRIACKLKKIPKLW